MTGNLTPIAYTARNASVPQQAGALRLPEGFAPRPVATPDLTGPNDEWILLPTGRQLGLRSDGLYPFPEEFQVLRSARALDVNQRRMIADPAVFGSQMAIH